MTENLPPIHDTVRFWARTEARTLAKCIEFRRTPLPGWTLAWLRQAAPVVMTRELSEVALRHAVREKVFPEAQRSVLHGVELFYRFSEKHGWVGRALSPSIYKLNGGMGIKVQAVGRYTSQITKSEWLVALQPRQDDFPDDEQFCMWRSALHYKFCQNDHGVMIVDLSKNPVSGKRELREITNRKHPLIDKEELDARLELIASCYLKAVEIVPERPTRPAKKDEDPDFGF